MSYLGLPLIPPDLKSITPYLQRAHETRSQDKIVSYWCAYYAAQVGISLKAASKPNRTFLAALLTTLENLRSTVGSSDAITVESASSAYVENFALRVFASADTEDRRGAATRKTAKKFLAATTFFDVLNVFEDRGPWEAHEEKARYAKWRAAEISKALREGRQPMPVSAGGELEPAETVIESMSAPPIPPPAELIDAPNTHVSHELEEPYSTSTFPLVSTAFGEGDADLDIPPGSALIPIDDGDAQPQQAVPTGSPEISTYPFDSPTVDMGQDRGPPTPIIGAESLTPSPTTLPQRPPSPSHFVLGNSPPSAVSSHLLGNPYPSAPPLPPPPSVPYIPIPPPRPPPVELTPGLIAKAQKHCRFAISALDYEDVEQARKELRAALAILGPGEQ